MSRPALWHGRHLGACLLIAGVICPDAEALDEAFHRLSGIEIQQEVVGHAVTDESHWWDVFAPGGALMMVDEEKQTAARWSIEDDELCLMFPLRSGRLATECFEIWRSEDLIDYRREGVSVVEGVLRDAR
jgi:hypothetical protein